MVNLVVQVSRLSQPPLPGGFCLCIDVCCTMQAVEGLNTAAEAPSTDGRDASPQQTTAAQAVHLQDAEHQPPNKKVRLPGLSGYN